MSKYDNKSRNFPIRVDYNSHRKQAQKTESRRQRDFGKQREAEHFDRLEFALTQPGVVALTEVQEQLSTAEENLRPRERRLVAEVLADGTTDPTLLRDRVNKLSASEIGRNRIWLVIALTLLLALTLVACGASPTGIPDMNITPTATAYVEPAPSGTPPAEITATPFEELDIDYGTFEGYQPIVDPVLESGWQEIIESGVASPLGIEVIDVSATNILVKVTPGNGYDDDTYFTISNVSGHEGEVLTVSLSGANKVAGGTAVRLAIGADQLPVALDANNVVVAYVNNEGQWVAGSTELAPELPGAPEKAAPVLTPLEQSQAFVEEAESYSGEVNFVVERWEEPWNTVPFFWNPTAQQWGTSTEFTTGTAGYPDAELDKNGESFHVAASGWENPDSSLVLIHPETGVQINLPGTVTLPGRGEVSIREIMAMSPDELNSYAVETTVDIINDPSARISEMQAAMIVKGTSFPAFVIEENRLFPVTGATGGDELPELKVDITEVPTQTLAIPIFSPETGDFMLWAIVQRGTLMSNAEFWTDDGTNNFDTIPFTDGIFGNDTDNFGIFMEYSSEPQPNLTYGRGGFAKVIGGDDPGMGDIYTIKRLLTATSEEEITSILAEQGIIWSVPSAILFDNAE